MKKSVYIIICALGLLLLAQALEAQTWGKTKRLTWNSGLSSYPVIAADSSNTLHIAWQDKTTGDDEIYYKRSTNGGAAWGSTKRLTWTSGQSVSPKIAVDSGNGVYVVWQDNISGDYEIYYKKSTSNGVTWGATRRITWGSSSDFPALAVDSSSNIHITWSNESPGNYEIYYKKSTNGGTSWTTKRLTWTSGASARSYLTTDSSDHVHLVYDDDTPGNVEVYYKKSTNGGTSWTTRRVTWIPGGSYAPDVAVDSNPHIHVVWVQWDSLDRYIFYKRSTDGGGTWDTEQLTFTSGGSYGPAIAVDSIDRIHVGFYDYTPGNAEIYYKKSTNGGMSWTTKRLTWNAGDSFGPSLIIDASDNIHAVWDDDTPGNAEIYYRKGIQ